MLIWRADLEFRIHLSYLHMSRPEVNEVTIRPWGIRSQ